MNYLRGLRPMYKAIFIDPVAQSVSSVEIPRDEKKLWAALHKRLGFTEITMIQTPDEKNVIVCDDVALLRQNPDQYGYFHLAFRDFPICNKALILGMQGISGNFKTCSLSVDWIKARIQFPLLRYQGSKLTEHQIQHPVFGEMTQVTNVPHFTYINPKDLN